MQPPLREHGSATAVGTSLGLMLLAGFFPVGFGHGVALLGMVFALGPWYGAPPLDSPVAFAPLLAIVACIAEFFVPAPRHQIPRLLALITLFATGVVYIWCGLVCRSGDGPTQLLPSISLILRLAPAVPTCCLAIGLWRRRRGSHATTPHLHPTLLAYTVAVCGLLWFVSDLAAGELGGGGSAAYGLPISCWSRASWEARGQLNRIGLALDIGLVTAAGVLVSIVWHWSAKNAGNDEPRKGLNDRS